MVEGVHQLSIQKQPGRGSPVQNGYCEKVCEIKEGGQEMVRWYVG